eukprot:scaffold17579_cov134-Isochrysis_galbana.AAC.1
MQVDKWLTRRGEQHGLLLPCASAGPRRAEDNVAEAYEYMAGSSRSSNVDLFNARDCGLLRHYSTSRHIQYISAPRLGCAQRGVELLGATLLTPRVGCGTWVTK